MSRGIDAWPALADFSLTLFLCTLVAAGVYAHNATLFSTERDELKKEVDRLTAELEARADCSGAAEFLDGFQGCLGAKAERIGCSVKVPETLVQFETNQDRPTAATEANANLLARCLFETASKFIHSASYNAIQTIQIDGHTDCDGDELQNFDLAGRRALWLYHAYLLVVKTNIDPSQRWQYLGKVTTRTYGEHAPTSDSLCQHMTDQAMGFAVKEDRRVTISVQLNETTGAFIQPPPLTPESFVTPQ